MTMRIYTVPEGFPEVPLFEGLGKLPSEISQRKVGPLDVFDCEVLGRPATLVVRRRFEGRPDLVGLWWLDDRLDDDEVTTLVADLPPSIIYVNGGAQFGSTASEDAVATFLGIWVPCPEKVDEDLTERGVGEEQLHGTLHHRYLVAMRCGVIDAPRFARAEEACGDAWDEPRRRLL